LSYIAILSDLIEQSLIPRHPFQAAEADFFGGCYFAYGFRMSQHIDER